MILRVEQVLKTYLNKDKEGNIKDIKHVMGNKYPILPFSTKMEPKLAKLLKDDFKTLDGIVGECYRILLNKSLPKQLSKTEDYNQSLKNDILNNIVNNVVFDQEDISLKNKLESIIDSLFFQNDNLIKYSENSFLYMNFTEGKQNSGLQKISSFLTSIFFDEELKNVLQNSKNTELVHNNILYKLITDNLPILDDKKSKKGKYINRFNDLSQQFKDDFLFLQTDKKTFLQNVSQLFKWYYFRYVSTLSIDLNNFFDSKEHPLYFVIESESFSISRMGYKHGWKFLNEKRSNLFSHAICLDLLNHLTGIQALDYQEIYNHYELLTQDQKQALLSELEELFLFYQKHTKDTWKNNDGWGEFNDFSQKQTLFLNSQEHPLKLLISKLWLAIEFQFKNSDRIKPYKQYSDWFYEFCKVNFLKNRGRNGFSLNLTEDMLLFLTKLCVRDQEKIRLKDYWICLENQGIYLDNNSKEHIINLFEKINLLEKKSDSGDAQYIKAI